MAGNENSGRHKDPKTILKLLNPIIDDAMPDIVQKMVDKAREGDKDCLIRLFNHKFGLPNMKLEATIKSMQFTPDEIALMRRVTITEIPTIDAEVKELPIRTDNPDEDIDTTCQLDTLSNDDTEHNDNLASENSP